MQVPPGVTTLSLTPKAPKCASSALIISVGGMPACVFSNPKHLSTLYGSGLFNVGVQTTNAIGGTLSLLVGSASFGTPKTITGPYGTVTFSAVPLSVGVVKLEAKVTVSNPSGALTATCGATVTVNSSKPTCSLRLPQALSRALLRLRCADLPLQHASV